MKKDIPLFLLIATILCFTVTQVNGAAHEPLQQTKNSLQAEATNLNPKVLDKALRAHQCAKRLGIDRNEYLTVIDFTKPSNEKRLWLFDLKNKKLLHHTWAAHGVNSGAVYAKHFSNRPNSRKSSIGVYNTAFTYTGKHGLALKLRGLEKGYNDNAFKRFIVVHDAWYVSKNFVKKYGRIGRSWGCPSIPKIHIKPVIDTIKDKTLLVIYYPDKKWLRESRFLHCD